ncbi:hypothetical protein ACFQ1S_28980 [Kibdelosporangium lantanae]|uniref:Uncharacterized protein n=1 Tax=Kibdelosporangium lantanae TaxID=1497396 RepID=A0ABW3MG20_9PSEU
MTATVSFTRVVHAVSFALNTATESTCPTVDKLTKTVFDKLPNG